MLSKWRHYGWSFSLLLCLGMMGLAVGSYYVRERRFPLARQRQLVLGRGRVEVYDNNGPLILVPYGAVAIVLGIAPTLWVLERYFTQRTPTDSCAACGYNLTGNISGVCPECGTVVARKS